ncbi:glutaminyl-peptide cyclotransferase [Desulfovibrio oxyclinae]|uniref:glutaminyl-peptide cyclotransferase n=1 Tax=Desulfovibrio oxyclinae TaxID=63560 RepID=UPI00036CC75A|nr:glutaminyl-peptide cyclotransferase [Desulfovibrio oxyclinae]
MARLLALLIVLCLPVSVLAAPVLPVTVLERLPHDTGAYTQGLIRFEGGFLESTGHYGESTLRRLDSGGQVLSVYRMPDELFAEGIAVAKERLFMLTWKSGQVWTFDPHTLEPSGRFELPERFSRREGWGLTFDGERLIMSDGSAWIHFHEPHNFRRIGSRMIIDEGHPVRRLNELEMVNGWLLANIWKRDELAVIDPATGIVAARLDLSPLRNRLNAGAEVANGIAWDEGNEGLYVTGKDWDTMFRIALPGVLKNPPGLR